MKNVTLGRTGISVPQNGFGVLPLQRVEKDRAVHILRRAYDGGMRYFDTARAYSDSEEKIGLAFAGGLRKKIYLASKTMAKTPEDFWKDLSTSLSMLQTAQACMNAWKRQNGKAKSAILASPFIKSGWHMKRQKAACTKPSSFLSPIWRTKRRKSWCACAVRTILDLSA